MSADISDNNAPAERPKRTVPATATVALSKKIITEEQLEETLRYCESEKLAGREKSFEDALVEKKYVTADVMMKLIAATIRKMNKALGEIAVEKGYVSQEHIDNALKIQAEKFKNGELILIDDLLVTAGLLSEKTRNELLESQNMKMQDWVLEGSEGDKADHFKESELYQADITMGDLAVAYSFITGKEFEIGLKYLEKAYKQGLKISLEKILMGKGFLDEGKASLIREIKKFLNTRDLDAGFADLAVEEDMLTRKISRAMFAKQLEEFDKKPPHCMPLSAILIEEKLMTIEQCNAILKKQNRVLISAGDTETETVLAVEAYSENCDTPEGTDVDPDISLSIGKDLLVATITIPMGYSKLVTIEEIKKLMEEQNITFGIVEDSYIKEKLLLDNLESRQIIVARGKPATMGRDAELVVTFQREYLNPGRVTKDGIIDFRDRGAVPFAAKGDLLVEIIPEQEGMSGMDIRGGVIPAPLVEGVSVTAGKGTELSADGLKIIASEEGQPSMTVTGEVSVFQEFIVPGDVDYNTGNIVFDGLITVKGSVKDGFSVSSGSLTVQDIEGGKIDLKGNLEVSGGIINSTIKIEGNIQAMYMANSNVESYGDVIVKREIIDSTILTSGACKSERTTIITSNISALNGIEAAQIGTDVSEPCVLKIGVNAHAENEMTGIQETLEKKIELLSHTQAALSELEKEQAKYQDMISETAQTQDQGEKTLRELNEQLETTQAENETSKLKSEIGKFEIIVRDAERTLSGYFESQDDLMNKALQARDECEKIIHDIEKQNAAIREIREWAKKQKKDPVLKTTKNIYQGTVIIGPNTSLTVKDTCRNSSIKELEGDSLKNEPAWIMKIVPN